MRWKTPLLGTTPFVLMILFVGAMVARVPAHPAAADQNAAPAEATMQVADSAIETTFNNPLIGPEAWQFTASGLTTPIVPIDLYSATRLWTTENSTANIAYWNSFDEMTATNTDAAPRPERRSDRTDEVNSFELNVAIGEAIASLTPAPTKRVDYRTASVLTNSKRPSPAIRQAYVIRRVA